MVLAPFSIVGCPTALGARLGALHEVEIDTGVRPGARRDVHNRSDGLESRRQRSPDDFAVVDSMDDRTMCMLDPPIQQFIFALSIIGILVLVYVIVAWIIGSTVPAWAYALLILLLILLLMICMLNGDCMEAALLQFGISL